MSGPSVHGDFLRNAVLETVIPHNPAVDIEAALTSALEGGAEDLNAVLSAIPQRSLLFFGQYDYNIIITTALTDFLLYSSR
jgi:hypothetical protein